ncbi:hypothetical protein ZEAMMB73_Zm00001d007916 [Zea mays]|nr:hypothetical protein ZEAMMB73_Zm00001d007916 [Zea mays]
MKTVKHH